MVSEEMLFENVDGQTDDGCLPILQCISPCMSTNNKTVLDDMEVYNLGHNQIYKITKLMCPAKIQMSQHIHLINLC